MSCTSSAPRAHTTARSTASTSRRRSTSAVPIAELPRLPFVVERAAGAVIGDTGYLLGGLTPGDVSIPSILSLDIETGAVNRIGSLPIAAHDAAAVSVAGQILLFGGSGAAGDLVQRFDPAARTVSTIGHLPRPLSDLGTAVIGNNVFVVGGYDGARARREILETTDGRSFRVAATLPEGSRYAAVAAAGSSLLVAGGQTDSASASRSVLLVDPASGSVRLLADLPVATAHAVLLVRGQTAFVIGGRDASGRPTARVWRIDLGTGTVAAAPPLPVPLADPALLSSGTRTILAGGATGSASSGGETNLEILFT